MQLLPSIEIISLILNTCIGKSIVLRLSGWNIILAMINNKYNY